MNKDYIELLKEIKLEPTKPNRSASMHQDIRCLICSSVFNATPKSKVQNYRKHEKVGCPKCTEIARYGESREAYIEKIQSMGYEFEIIPTSRNHKVPVRNKNCDCGRWWITKSNHLISGRSFCQPCNNDTKRERMAYYNSLREKEYDFRFESYKTNVHKLTNRTYKKYKNEINPNNHKRTPANVVGGHQLDHILPVKVCFNWGIPIELCSSKENLRIVTRMENAVKWAHVTEIPKIFESYIPEDFDLKLKELNN